MADLAGQHSPVQPAHAMPPPPPTAPPGWVPKLPLPVARTWRRRRTVLGLLALVVLGLAIGGAWVVVHGLEARSQLAAAQRQLPALRSDIVHGDLHAAN